MTSAQVTTSPRGSCQIHSIYPSREIETITTNQIKEFKLNHTILGIKISVDWPNSTMEMKEGGVILQIRLREIIQPEEQREKIEKIHEQKQGLVRQY